jgi:hypothetical protein
MPNSYTGIFPALVAAFSDAQSALHAPNALLETTLQDFNPGQTADLYDTIKLNFPASAYSASDVAAGSVSVSDVTATPRSLQLNLHPAVAFKLPDYDTMRGYGIQQLRNMFVDEAIEKVLAYLNGQVAALITAGNFSQVVAGGSQDIITTAEASSLRQTLVSAKVPVKDTANLFLALHPVVYGKMLADTTWVGGNNISSRVAEKARLDGELQRVLGATPLEDLDMPVATGVYTSLFYHRRAIATAARALPVPQAGGVAGMIVTFKGIPLRVTIDWNQLLLSYVMTVDALFGCTVFRADHAVRHTST